MKLIKFLGIGALMLSFATGSAFAADKAAKQAEIMKNTNAALEKFYAAKPELKAAVAKAPGYAVFTTYGLSFIVGGSGGAGVVHDNKTKKVTYMSIAGASAGFQLGASQNDLLLIFKNDKAMNGFIEKGWGASGEAGAAAGADNKSAGGTMGSSVMNDIDSFTLTKTGIQAGIAIGGSKAWKDADLN